MVTAAAAGNEPGVPAPAPIVAPRAVEPGAVSLQAVSVAYDQGDTARVVLDRFTYDFAPGRMTVVTGRSGTGKTTLLRLIAGLSRADGGRVALDGRSLEDCDAEQLAAMRRERTGYMAQEPSVVGFLSAIENVELTLRIRGTDPAEARERAAVMVRAVGLGHRATQRAERLSAGEQQRLALARALAGARGLLTVDEPTSRLDEANAAAIAQLLGAAAAQEGQTVICASHDSHLLGIADHVVTLAAGDPDLRRLKR
jgi:putative ABC transport system ATP-binding protein